MLITLPNGLQVEAIEPFEAHALYHEIYEMGVYNGHGICIDEGDTVVDVGANIGLFSILMLQSAPHLQLFAVEPVPLLHDLLRNNLKRYAGTSQVELLPVALAAQSGEAEFIYTPHSTMTSSMASAQTKIDARIGEIVHAGLTDLAQIYPERRPMYERFQATYACPFGRWCGYAWLACRLCHTGCSQPSADAADTMSYAHLVTGHRATPNQID